MFYHVDIADEVTDDYGLCVPKPAAAYRIRRLLTSSPPLSRTRAVSPLGSFVLKKVVHRGQLSAADTKS